MPRTTIGANPNTAPKQIKLPAVVFVSINMIANEIKLPTKLKREAFAGCWLAVRTVVINCKTNCKQKNTKTIKANVLNSADMLAGEFSIIDQLRKGLIIKNSINTAAIIMLNIA